MTRLILITVTIIFSISTAFGQSIEIGQDAKYVKQIIEWSTQERTGYDSYGKSKGNNVTWDVKYKNGQITDVIQCFSNQYLLDFRITASFCKHYIMEYGQLAYVLTQYEDVSTEKLIDFYEKNYGDYKSGKFYFSNDYKHYSQIYIADNGYATIEWRETNKNELPIDLQTKIANKLKLEQEVEAKKIREEVERKQNVGNKYSVNNNKAIKLYEEGRGYYDQRKNELAELTLLQSIKNEPNFAEAELLLAFVYTENANHEKAIEHYQKSVNINPNLFPEAHASLGLLYFDLGKYNEAKLNLENYLKFTDAPLMMKPLANKVLADCDFAIEALKHPVPFNPINLGEGVNSAMPEYFPALSADNKYLLFTRRLEDKSTYSGFNEDFFISKYDGNNWMRAQPLKGINSQNNEGAPTISPNGQFLIFTSCEDPYEGYGEGRKGLGSCDLFYAYNIGGKWTNPKNLNNPVNTIHWETQPSFSSDGKTLYFVRGLKTRGGIKNQDIYTSELSEEGTWSIPKSLSNVVNTDGREESVFIHPDGKTLYFSSDGHPGMGGLDIYMTVKNDDGNWSKPVNMGYPINTFNDENSFLVDAVGQYAYLSSNREGGFGDLDLYKFELPQHLKPNVVNYLAGKVYDAETKQALPARFELIDLKTGKVAIQSYADEVTGEYLVCLPVNQDYALNVSHEGYLFHSENFTLTGGTATKPYEKNVGLNKIKVGETVVLKNVFFETAKFDLKEQSRVELDKLVAFLTKNPNLKIELGGHTDNVGDKKMNQVLSDNRAKAVYSYLVQKGISKERLTTKGYGDTLPIATNDTQEGRAENRRTEFKVIAN